MRIKLPILITTLLFGILMLEVYYLKVLPFSFVRIYYTSEPKEFNKPPTEVMTVELDGYEFSYRVPCNLKQDVIKEVKEIIKKGDLNTIDSLIIIASWVRGKLKFGMPGDNSNKLLVEDILNNSKNNDLSVWCDSYARLFVIVCQLLDIPARILELEGHVVPEAFIRKNKKWVMIDPTRGYYMAKGREPLSVVEIIYYYKKRISLTPTVFAGERGNDSLYQERYENEWKKVYLNGYTVVSDKNRVNIQKIKNTIFRKLQLPIVKMQFVDDSSRLIGNKERLLRYIIVLNFIALIMIIMFTISGR